jgi:hypothetical protein
MAFTRSGKFVPPAPVTAALRFEALVADASAESLSVAQLKARLRVSGTPDAVLARCVDKGELVALLRASQKVEVGGAKPKVGLQLPFTVSAGDDAGAERGAEDEEEAESSSDEEPPEVEGADDLGGAIDWRARKAQAKARLRAKEEIERRLAKEKFSLVQRDGYGDDDYSREASVAALRAAERASAAGAPHRGERRLAPGGAMPTPDGEDEGSRHARERREEEAGGPAESWYTPLLAWTGCTSRAKPAGAKTIAG